MQVSIRNILDHVLDLSFLKVCPQNNHVKGQNEMETRTRLMVLQVPPEEQWLYKTSTYFPNEELRFITQVMTGFDPTHVPTPSAILKPCANILNQS